MRQGATKRVVGLEGNTENTSQNKLGVHLADASDIR